MRVLRIRDVDHAALDVGLLQVEHVSQAYKGVGSDHVNCAINRTEAGKESRLLGRRDEAPLRLHYLQPWHAGPSRCRHPEHRRSPRGWRFATILSINACGGSGLLRRSGLDSIEPVGNSLLRHRVSASGTAYLSGRPNVRVHPRRLMPPVCRRRVQRVVSPLPQWHGKRARSARR